MDVMINIIFLKIMMRMKIWKWISKIFVLLKISIKIKNIS